MAFGSAALKFGSTFLYALEFCCAAIVLGIYSYFLSVLADRDLIIPTWEKAVEGISGAIVLYTIFAVLLTCFLGGKMVFAFLGIVMDLLCCGGMVAIAILTRDGSRKCSGDVRTPIGDGQSDSKLGFGSNGEGRQITYASSLGFACRLNSACFAVAIAGAILFLFSAVVQLFLGRKHNKEKRLGPSPANGYTKGSGVRFWQRNRRTRSLRDPEVGTVPVTTGGLAAPVAHHDYRPSHDTAYTGSTVAAPGVAHDKPVNGGYHTAPIGTHHTHHNTTTPATNY